MKSNIDQFAPNLHREVIDVQDDDDVEIFICLNPNCLSERIITLASNLADRESHHNCKGWIHPLNYLKRNGQSKANWEANDLGQVDYLQNPIESIFNIERFALSGWENQLFACLQQILKSIEEQLTKIFIKTQQKINNHLKINRQVSAKIQSFCEDISDSWSQDHQTIYNKHLKHSLLQMNRKGRIKISNSQILGKKMRHLLKQINSIGECIWNEEFEYDLNQRRIFKSKKEELINYSKLQLNELTSKIQQIENSQRQKIGFIENKDSYQMFCFKCQHIARSTASSLKIRKQQCRKSILTHFSTNHQEQLAIKMIKNDPIKLTVKDLKKQILFKSIKKVIIIDKENSILNYNTLHTDQDPFYIEVLSKNSENIAKGKYLMADSTGKDAADILIIIILSELSKLQVQEISLITNDHYGLTLQPIFASLGVNIQVIKKQKMLKMSTNNY